MTDFTGLLVPLTATLRAAGAAILSWYTRRDVEARLKADHSPVTAADLAAHRVLAERLPSLLPGVPVVSEETASDAAATVATLASAALAWLVDPLDGTRDFLARTDEFTVNVALLAAGAPVVGGVHVPVTGEVYVAARGGGAFRQREADGPLEPLRCRRLDPAHPVCLVSRQHQAGEAARLAALAPQVQVRSAGSSLKYALIAAGEADLALRVGPTSLWDTAAAQCLLEAAGGAILGRDGAPLAYRTGTLLNPPFLACGDLSFDWRPFLALL